MNIENKKNSFSRAIIVPLLLLLIMWMVFYFDKKYHLNLHEFSILPRSVKHCLGIIISPFIHGDLNHIFSNSLPVLVLGTLLYYYYQEIAFKITLLTIVLTGLFIWFFGNLDSNKESFHIGASGLVYSMASFLVISGFIRKHKLLFGISLLVIFLYGTFIWGIFPIEFQKAILFYQGPDNISWEGHLGGFLSGTFLAFVYKNTGFKKEEYSWEKETDDEENEDYPYWMEGIDKASEDNENESSIPKSSPDPLQINYQFFPKKENGKNI